MASVMAVHCLVGFELPMLIAYGTEDIGITQIDGTIDKWLTRVNAIKNSNTEITIVDGASHGFNGFENVLAKSIERFITK